MSTNCVKCVVNPRTNIDLLCDSCRELQALEQLPWKVYQINDCDWWMARTLPEAVAHYLEMTGCEADEDAAELTTEDLDRLHYVDELPHDRTDPAHWQCECGAMADTGCRWDGSAYHHHHGYPMGHVLMKNIHRRTFREELQRRIDAGPEVGMFATNEF